MSAADVIIAILDGDVGAMRQAFCAIAVGERLSPNAVYHTAIVIELCAALRQDTAELPQSVCMHMGTPQGTTFAQGADRVSDQLDLWAARSVDHKLH